MLFPHQSTNTSTHLPDFSVLFFSPLLFSEPRMQASDSGSDSATPVALRTSASVQAPVVQPVPASQQVTHTYFLLQRVVLASTSFCLLCGSRSSFCLFAGFPCCLGALVGHARPLTFRLNAKKAEDAKFTPISPPTPTRLYFPIIPGVDQLFTFLSFCAWLGKGASGVNLLFLQREFLEFQPLLLCSFTATRVC